MEQETINILHFYRLGLTTELLSKDEVIRWVDEQISNSINGSEQLIELSLSHNKSDLIDNLTTIVGLVIPDTTVIYIFSKLNKYAQELNNLDPVVHCLYNLGSLNKTHKELNSRVIQLIDQYDLAIDGVFSVEKSNHEIRNFLNEYKNYA